jgi:hypothetical protein
MKMQTERKIVNHIKKIGLYNFAYDIARGGKGK